MDERVDYSNADLHDAYLNKVDWMQVILVGTDLRGANLIDASLQWANLQNANLEGATLMYARLKEANLENANLQGAELGKTDLKGAQNLTDSQLASTLGLRGATMPDGNNYNGRFNLPNDAYFNEYQEIIYPPPPEEMAKSFGVSLEEYQQGQAWARENLHKLRDEMWDSQEKLRAYWKRKWKEDEERRYRHVFVTDSHKQSSRSPISPRASHSCTFPTQYYAFMHDFFAKNTHFSRDVLVTCTLHPHNLHAPRIPLSPRRATSKLR